MKLFLSLLTLLFAIFSVACTTDKVDQQFGIVISDAKLRPPLPGRSMAAGYFEINNNGKTDRLIAVSSPLTDKVEIHTHLNEDGIMKMRRVEGIDLPPGETIFEIGGHHIMFFGVSMPSDAKDVALTLNFEKSEPITIIADVIGDDYGSNHSGH